MIIFRNNTEERIYKADKKRFEKMMNFLSPADKVLKVGAGLGFQAQILSDYSPGNITVVEIENRLHPDINLSLVMYDGKTLPFPDNKFNAAIVNHVLHHTPNPKEVLKEITRVTSGRIIIIEELWTNWLQKISIIFNCWYKGHKAGERNTKLYFNSYQSEQKWLKTFRNCGLEIEYKSETWTQDKLIPFRIGFFVLNRKIK